MAPLDAALKYMDIFYSGRELARLYEIMADELKFEGPFFHFDSARNYIESLRSDPPLGCEYKILHAFENGQTVNLIYQFSKPNISTPMSQLFKVRDGKITEVLLIFDTGQFS